MSSLISRWSVPLLVTAITLSHNNSSSLPEPTTNPVSWGVAYFEPPRSIGTPIEDVARAYTGFGLAARIEGRLRLATDVSLDASTRELILRRLTQRS
jgi:hypothetical protein